MRTSDSRQILSPREVELVTFASMGYTDKAIALKLGISEATIGTYWGRIRIKLGPLNRTELVTDYFRLQQQEALQVLRDENAKLIAELRRIANTPKQADSTEEWVFENAPDAILLVSEEGLVTRSNLAASEMFGRTNGEMSRISLSDLLPERFRQVHHRHRLEYFEHPERRAMGEHLNTPALHKDGLEFNVCASLSSVHTNTGLVVICILRQADCLTH